MILMLVIIMIREVVKALLWLLLITFPLIQKIMDVNINHIVVNDKVYDVADLLDGSMNKVKSKLHNSGLNSQACPFNEIVWSNNVALFNVQYVCDLQTCRYLVYIPHNASFLLQGYFLLDFKIDANVHIHRTVICKDDTIVVLWHQNAPLYSDVCQQLLQWDTLNTRTLGQLLRIIWLIKNIVGENVVLLLNTCRT